MAYDENLAGRVRAELPGAVEKRMFGGLCFMLGGNMAVGVMSDGLLVRLPPGEDGPALAEDEVGPFVMGDRVGKGWVVVRPSALATAESLGAWVGRGAGYARSLPEK